MPVTDWDRRNDSQTSVARDSRIDVAGPGVNAPGNRLCLLKPLIPQPNRDRHRPCAMVAENKDGRIFIKLFERTSGDLIHWDEHRAVDVGCVVLPRLADVEQEGWCGTGKVLFELIDGDFKIHRDKDKRSYLKRYCGPCGTVNFGEGDVFRG